MVDIGLICGHDLPGGELTNRLMLRTSPSLCRRRLMVCTSTRKDRPKAEGYSRVCMTQLLIIEGDFDMTAAFEGLKLRRIVTSFKII